MATFVTMKMHGFKELDKALEELGSAMSREILLKALKKAAEPTMRKGESTAPRGKTLETVNSIGARTMNRKRFGPEIAVGPNSRQAHLIEFGTKPRVTVVDTKAVLSDGTTVFGARVENKGVRPNRFWTRAWESTKDEVLRDLRELVWAEIHRAVKRLTKQAGSGKLTKRGKGVLL